MREFTIDLNKWRCGHLGKRGNKLGIGLTKLLNHEGYMCCLGMICSQCGVSNENLIHHYTPNSLKDKRVTFLEEIQEDAMKINDSEYTSVKQKINKLKKLFLKHDIILNFKGKVMKREKREVVVNGVKRVVYLGKNIGPGKWKAQIYFNQLRTSVSGIYQEYSNGAKRFTVSKDAVNGNLL